MKAIRDVGDDVKERGLAAVAAGIDAAEPYEPPTAQASRRAETEPLPPKTSEEVLSVREKLLAEGVDLGEAKHARWVGYYAARGGNVDFMGRVAGGSASFQAGVEAFREGEHAPRRPTGLDDNAVKRCRRLTTKTPDRAQTARANPLDAVEIQSLESFRRPRGMGATYRVTVSCGDRSAEIHGLTVKELRSYSAFSDRAFDAGVYLPMIAKKLGPNVLWSQKLEPHLGPMRVVNLSEASEPDEPVLSAAREFLANRNLQDVGIMDGVLEFEGKVWVRPSVLAKGALRLLGSEGLKQFEVLSVVERSFVPEEHKRWRDPDGEESRQRVWAFDPETLT